MMQTTRSKAQHLPTTIFILLGVLVWMLMCGDMATAGSYTDSAHGSDSYGVSRSGTTHTRGDCANCHDSCDNEFMLFAPLYTSQSDNLCFQCHRSPDTSIQVDMPYQRNYSRLYGGDTTITCPKNIRAAFRFIDDAGAPQNQCGSLIGSSHNLSDIRNYLNTSDYTSGWGWHDLDLADINPCSGCHNPHKAQRHNYPVDSKGTSPISLPSTHNGDWDVYGAETSERMNRYTYQYQPPYKYPAGSNGYEWSSESRAPDINTLCLDCHKNWGVMSTRYGELMALGSSGGVHGASHGTPKYFYGGLDDPYLDFQYVTLMCTDCHEPHGSPNEKLLRSCVNGKKDIVVPGPGQWLEFCTACHHLSYSGASWHRRKPDGNFDENTDCRSSCHAHFFH